MHFSTKRIAPVVEKVLRSAIQNANYLSQEQGLDIDVDNLYVRTAVANEGPRMKRIRPAPMGRAFRYQRRLAHIIVTVAEKKAAAAASAATPEPAATAAQAQGRAQDRSQEGAGQEGSQEGRSEVALAYKRRAAPGGIR